MNIEKLPIKMSMVFAGILFGSVVLADVRIPLAGGDTLNIKEKGAGSANYTVSEGSGDNAAKIGELGVKNEDTSGGTVKMFDSGGTNSIGLKAPDSLGGDVVITLPNDDGNAGQILHTDGSGDTYWANLPGEASDACSPGLTWMDKNLGATQVATSSTDYLAYGDFYQWGRLADGHETIVWTSPTASDDAEQSRVTSTNSATDIPGHDDFILEASSSPYDWRAPTQNDNLWQGTSGINNPCPSGFRLPTEAELENVRTACFVTNNAAGAFGSFLKLPVAGDRKRTDGSLSLVGSYGFYWSSTVDGSTARNLFFYASGASMSSGYRAYGFSVRCVK